MRPTLIAYEPVKESSTLYGREFVEDLTASHERYQHVISAVGGFDQASFVIKGDRDRLDAWFEDGLMRRVVFYNPEQVAVWEGYVERLNYTVGSMQKTKGMSNVCNRVYMRFSPFSTTTTPPEGDVPITLVLNDLDSQSRWGVKAQVVSGGELTHEEAYAWARVILTEGAEPKLGESVNTAESSAPNLEVQCRGYWEALSWVPYLYSVGGEIHAHQALQEVLAYFDTINPGWIDPSPLWMDFNFRRERRLADEYRTCKQVIESLIARGGLGGERWVGGFYQDRRFVYKPAEDYRGLYAEYLFYRRALADPAQRIYDTSGAEVQPWDVVPDRILITVDV